ncbi:MAG TPA: MarR family transcriptional regulator [Candidatus Dormibacteraeota bacterium]|nr:MarR family transcriptional regulator [Candidatus Dormibacteraeota bacterium]
MSQLEKLPLNTPIKFPADAAGCLYDPRVRELMRQFGAHVPQAPAEAFSALRLAAKKLHRAMERYADERGLSEGRLQIIMRLASQPEHRLALGELAEMMEVAPRTITGLIDNLERDGWVARVHDGSDRRSIQAQLTKKGLDQVLVFRREAVRVQGAATRGLTADELVQLRHLCLRVIQNMDKAQGAEHAR